MRARRWGLAASAVVFFILVIPGSLQAVEVQDTLNRETSSIREKIHYRTTWGTTEEFGGGRFVRISLGDRASLGFIWGTRENRGPITIISRGVDVEGQRALTNGSTVPVTSSSIMVYRLKSLVEFEDGNRNGFFDPVSGNGSDEGERSLKGASLSLAWSFRQKPVRRTENGLEWTFSLEARNVSYRWVERNGSRPLMSSSRTSSFVDSIRFVFHLKVSALSERRMILRYGSDPETATRVGETGSSRYDLEGVNATTKMDHEISGWDYSPDNGMPALMLRFSLHLGRTFDPSFLKILSDKRKEKIFGDSIIDSRCSGSPERTLWSGIDSKPRIASLAASDDGEISLFNRDRILARLFWNSRSLERNDAGGRTLKTNMQIFSLSLIGPFDPVWTSRFLGASSGVGISMSGSYVYKRAENINHDPGIETLGWSIKEAVQVDGGVQFLPGFPLDIRETSILVAVLLVAAMIAAVVISSLSRRRSLHGDEELMREEEDEVLLVHTRKRDWDGLRPK